MPEAILIVDDERGIRDTLRAVLEDEGLTAEAVASGEECLKAFERRAYGCVLLDVWLPGIDGMETLEQVRATKLGAFDFIEKPLSIEKTVLTVRNALRQRGLERVNAQLIAEMNQEYM